MPKVTNGTRTVLTIITAIGVLATVGIAVRGMIVTRAQEVQRNDTSIINTKDALESLRRDGCIPGRKAELGVGELTKTLESMNQNLKDIQTQQAVILKAVLKQP